MSSNSLRAIGATDANAVLALNEAAIPAVTPMSAIDLDYYGSVAEHIVVTGDDTGVNAFLILLEPGIADYDSPNYRWFSERYDSFCYVDRIVVAEAHRGAGLGRVLYEFAIETAGRRPLLAEVNTRPPNDVSLAFHTAAGFSEIGRQAVEGGAKEVAMLCRSAGGA